MATIEKALQIAAGAHDGQKDKEGLPYILHPLRVMARVEGLDAQVVAVLHDVIEDTVVTADDLRAAGFSEALVGAVLCVTHRKGESYADYVVRCKANPVARQVKIADLQENTRLDRFLLRSDRLERDLARVRRYVFSYKFLTDRLTEDEYRRALADQIP
jgi:hypothetical protein